MTMRVGECYFLMFFACSVLGWCMEVTCKLFQFHRFINRGFLIGPYCPIYGFGAVLVTALLSRFSADPVAVFALAMVVCGTLEYLTSYVMEKLFHARWWDYSQKRFNLNGRVCADTLIPFGLLGLGMVYGLKPVLFGWFMLLDQQLLDALCAGLMVILLTDVVISTLVLSKIRKTANLSGKDDTEAITQSARELLAKQSALVRRILRAFPYAKIYNAKVAKDLKEKRAALRRELKARRQQVRQEIEQREAKLRQELDKHGK
ncbi:MAG: hypothetical protein PHY12_00890 [Eubacteriales bacterium]|nr:hypothetical protein [Eubacteriales bacterium]